MFPHPAILAVLVIGSWAFRADASDRIGNAWSDPHNPIVSLFGGERLDLWSLKDIIRPDLPGVENSQWIRSPLDAFILARLEQNRLTPSDRADPRSLVRRVSYNLTGLPPDLEAVESFVEAFERNPDGDVHASMVERYLASPEYGEHQARLWMDVIRYSDSNGFDWDEYRPKAWMYRDYLIRSFNQDKPFNRLILEQLAGDEMLSGPPENEAERDMLIATGYLRMGPQDNSASLFDEQARSRAELMADLVETTSSAFLGLSMACCRCHHHKHDPLSQQDHYRLRAFFEPVQYGDHLILNTSKEAEGIRSTNDALEASIARISSDKSEFLKPWTDSLRQIKRDLLNEPDRRLIFLNDEELNEAERDAKSKLEKQIEPNETEVLDRLSDSDQDRIRRWDEEIDRLRAEKKTFNHGLLMTDTEDGIPETRVLNQGHYKDEMEAVLPGFLSILDPNAAVIATPPNPKTTGRRYTLAKWIASESNPLTARILVNRIWQQHFGKGLVDTPNDFGLAGGRPSHRELLDWLADEFIRSGWSFKHLHRLILNSSTFQQSSIHHPAFDWASGLDSDNRLLWRQNLRRLSGEQLRDSLLKVSGSLLAQMGGPPSWPNLPSDILQANPAFLDDNAEKTKGWYPSDLDQRNVRSVYLIQKRTVRIPFLETFDLPENSTSCPERTESIVAPQALTLLNGEEVIQAAEALAKQLEMTAGAEGGNRVVQAFRCVLQRDPDSEEIAAAETFLANRSLVEFCRAMFNLNEFVFVF